MSSRAAWLLLGGLLLALVIGLSGLLQRRVGAGDVFPPYSSQRADPLGTRALYDALAQLPGMRIERWHKPMAMLPAGPARTILLAGFTEAQWKQFPEEDFAALDAAVREGGRVVIAFRAASAETDAERKRRVQAEEEAERRRKETEKDHPRAKPEIADILRRWAVELEKRNESAVGDALRSPGADHALPARLAGQSDLFFKPENNSDWRIVYRRGSEAVLIERSLGKGSLVLAADAYFLSNEALQNERSTALLVWIVGSHAHVVFDESHLGVLAQVGVAALARHYGLEGAFFMFLLLAGLFVWRRMALFVPPVPDAPVVTLSYHPAAGLEALLRRAVTTSQLAAACVTEWKRTARPGDTRKVDAALADAPKAHSAVALYNLAARSLRRR